ncbi:MAG: hypothetical protein K2Q15_04030 [Burkholderiales bacterium]|nr:hypothetical protein [Burkholderiales bacterium]
MNPVVTSNSYVKTRKFDNVAVDEQALLFKKIKTVRQDILELTEKIKNENLHIARMTVPSVVDSIESVRSVIDNLHDLKGIEDKGSNALRYKKTKEGFELKVSDSGQPKNYIGRLKNYIYKDRYEKEMQAAVDFRDYVYLSNDLYLDVDEEKQTRVTLEQFLTGIKRDSDTTLSMKQEITDHTDKVKDYSKQIISLNKQLEKLLDR